MPSLRYILASGSIGRKELIKKLPIPFEIYPSGYEEDMGAKKENGELAEFLARGKAEYIAPQFSSSIIVGADTFIALHDEKIGKPSSLPQARKIMEKMSNQWIEVISGIAVIQTDEKGGIKSCSSAHEVTRLKIKKLMEEDIQLLLNQEHVLKMSGGFGIEGVGGKMVEKIEGDYDNVIGLPVLKLKKLLKKSRK